MTPAKKNSIITILLTLAVAAVVTVFYPHPQEKGYVYEVGKPWSYAKLIAPFDIPVKPDSATFRHKRDSLDAVFEPVFRRDTRLADSVLASLPKSGVPRAAAIYGIIRNFYNNPGYGIVSADERDMISDGSLSRIRIMNQNVLTARSTAGLVSPGNIADTLRNMYAADSVTVRFINSLDLPRVLKPNVVRDPEATHTQYELALSELAVAREVILPGQTIIDNGVVLTEQDYTNLQTYETMLAERTSRHSGDSFLLLLGQFLYVSLMLTALFAYLYFNCPEIMHTFRKLLFIYVLITVFFLIGVGANAFTPSGIYLVPMTIVPILALVFFDARTALFVSFVLTMICAPVSSFALEYILLQFCAASAAVNTLRELRQRSQLLRTAALVGTAYVMAYIALTLLMNGSFDAFSWRMVIFLLINAVLTSLAYILMFVMERSFGFVSVVTLVELADINSPLLRRLSDDCPGTFQHSMAVSNLAADAAKHIDANVPLVRAGALYHDIGKLRNPAFFTENQHGVNPHDALPPQKSAEIIINHVADGVKLADKAGLPGLLKAFIREHHGAGKAKYFYFTACKNSPDDSVDPAPFTYPGPNPRSRETSLLMMADAVEAASRSLKEHTPQAIAELVNRIIDSQIADGLHNESPLSFRDVQIIKQAFIKRLMTIYHSRITYPDDPSKKADSTAPGQ